MADLLKLKNNVESDEIDLLAGTYQLRDQSWMTGTPQPSSDYESVPFGAHPVFQSYLTQVETIDLIAQNTTHSTIRTAQQEIMQALESARIWHQHPLWTIYNAADGPDPWFLHWNIDGEQEKRCLLYEGSLAGTSENCAEPFISSDVSLLRMALNRHPFWEPVISASENVAQSSLTSLGGTKTVAGVDGDVWARIASTSLYGVANSGPIYRTWMGIREEMAGMTNFESVWELEDGTKAGGAANSTGRAGYSGSAHVRISSPPAFLTNTVQQSVDAMCAAEGHADHAHQLGEYLVLCRCAVDSGTVGIQLRHGFLGLGTMMPSEEVFVSNTDWRLIELGNVTIPPMGGSTLNVDGNYAQYTMLQIYTEQVSGTSVLDLDCLIMIPRHHFWFAAGGAVANSSAYAHMGETGPSDKYTCYGTGNSRPRYTLEYNMKDWYLPTGDSVIVVAGEREDEHVLADNLGLSLYYYPRWGMYR